MLLGQGPSGANPQLNLRFWTPKWPQEWPHLNLGGGHSEAEEWQKCLGINMWKQSQTTMEGLAKASVEGLGGHP